MPLDKVDLAFEENKRYRATLPLKTNAAGLSHLISRLQQDPDMLLVTIHQKQMHEMNE